MLQLSPSLDWGGQGAPTGCVSCVWFCNNLWVKQLICFRIPSKCLQNGQTFMKFPFSSLFSTRSDGGERKTMHGTSMNIFIDIY